MNKRGNGEGTWGKKKVNGKQYFFYRYPDKKYIYGKTRAEVQLKMKQYEEENTVVCDDTEIRKLMVDEYCMYWLDNIKKPTIKPSTYEGYCNCIKGQLSDNRFSRLGSVSIGKLDLDTLNRHFSSMANHYSKGTIKKNYAILVQCLKYANKHGHIMNSIDIDEIILPHDDNVVKESREIHFLTDDDMKRLYDESKRVNVKGYNFGGCIGKPTYGNNANMIIFILHTGLRISEAIGLQWESIDFKNKTMTVVNNATTKDASGNRNGSVKTKAGNRTIPLNKIAWEIIEKEVELNPKHKNKDYVFITENGGQIKSRQNVGRTLQNMVDRAGLSVDHLTLHELRHSFGSALLRHGMDIKVVSQLLGHKDVSVTYNIYIHILDDQMVKAVEVLDKLNEL